MDPVRPAEDAAVLDTLSGGRVGLGFGAGGSRNAFELFDVDVTARQQVYADKLARVKTALAGAPLIGHHTLDPPADGLRERLWQATFSVAGAQRAGAAGDGLLLSRTRSRDPTAPGAPISEVQQPLVDAYLAALPADTAPRIGVSRSVVRRRREHRRT